jgi:hypothetical protein
MGSFRIRWGKPPPAFYRRTPLRQIVVQSGIDNGVINSGEADSRGRFSPTGNAMSRTSAAHSLGVPGKCLTFHRARFGPLTPQESAQQTVPATKIHNIHE